MQDGIVPNNETHSSYLLSILNIISQRTEEMNAIIWENNVSICFLLVETQL